MVKQYARKMLSSYEFWRHAIVRMKTQTNNNPGAKLSFGKEGTFLMKTPSGKDLKILEESLPVSISPPVSTTNPRPWLPYEIPNGIDNSEFQELKKAFRHEIGMKKSHSTNRFFNTKNTMALIDANDHDALAGLKSLSPEIEKSLKEQPLKTESTADLVFRLGQLDRPTTATGGSTAGAAVGSNAYKVVYLKAAAQVFKAANARQLTFYPPTPAGIMPISDGDGHIIIVAPLTWGPTTVSNTPKLFG